MVGVSTGHVYVKAEAAECQPRASPRPAASNEACFHAHSMLQEREEEESPICPSSDKELNR